MRKLKDLTDEILKYHPGADLNIILDAYVYSAKAHRGQVRRSGEAYLSHPVEVAYNLTRLKMDEKTVAAGLLHDTLEDTLATPEEIQELFGEEIYQLVDGVTKISQIQFTSNEEKQAQNYRKMILAMARDIRVVLIKLADRAHNLETLDSLSPARQIRIARETFDIYAPLANRLGIGWLKAELENGSFKYLQPDDYRKIKEKVAESKEELHQYLDKVCATVSQELEQSQIKAAVTGRTKHLYSIFKKMGDQRIGFHDVHDIIGVRVITKTVKDCYATLGLIHSLWKPVPGRFKDYIAMPKPNMYQSLHTTVIGPDGERVEVQIRTEEMHRVCEEGIAAHWQYKEGGGGHPRSSDEQLLWVRHLIENQKDLKNPKEFLNAFKVDLFPDEVYVFTPKGDVISLPRGATPVDFAYAVHTDIGNHCSAARVNGKIVPLRYRLRNGDQVQVVASKQKTPTRDWLSFVATSKARNRIANFINSAEKAKSLALGRELLEKEIRDYGLNPAVVMKGKALEEAIQNTGFSTLDSLLTAIGFGRVSTHHVVEKLVPKEKIEEKRKQETSRVKLKEHAPPAGRESAIKVTCFNDNILLRVGKCCNPVPGDPIVGYITRGRGITVHHLECSSVTGLANESERMVEVEWDKGPKTTYSVRVSIVTEDKPGMLANIGSVFAACGINITQANIKQVANQRTSFDLYIEIRDLNHLNQTLEKVREVAGVLKLARVKEYGKKRSGKNRVDGWDENLNPLGGQEILVS